ncbi:PREDICTED: pentatricopeptide repeat-containing protein At4g20740 isoform X2 [Tarenaya hassleriana]|uniref:pentatricopeptide repeat-containing protein At4g20740 isoform X2 n=1 Tax=Tarenaya hassleriana TaxID=28532 RepID=UPI00053C0FEE|nr:PREDICTED: pentatricopeptide repeat-containing protein At4g20740 isoform X2 [Tarenaya hassleriana]
MKSPKPPNLPQGSQKSYFYGHRKPSRNRSVVYGGLFSNRQSLSRDPSSTSGDRKTFDFRKWDPESRLPPAITPPSPVISAASERLSPIARYILDAFRKNHDQWGPSVVAELNKLRRVTPNIVAEVLKIEKHPATAAKFFHWAGHFRAADQLPELMDSQGRPPSEKQFEILIRMHADKKRGLRVYYIYEKMKKFGVKPRVFLYNRIMDALIKSGNLDLALSVYEDFREDGLVEESTTFMILIKGLCKAGRMEEMLEILTRMRKNLCKPDVFAYTAMIRTLVSEGDMDASLRIWDEMEHDGIEPDVMAYGTLVMGLCKGGRVERGYELFMEMKDKKILIDREIYKVLINGFVVDGKVGSACDLWKDLVDSGYIADLEIYNSVIRGLCNVKQVDKAYKLFQVAVQEELEPDLETINPIMVAYVVMKRVDDFCDLLEQIQKLGYPTEEYLPQFFMLFCKERERIKMALDLFDVLKTKGHSRAPVFNILMDALYKMGDIQKSLSLFFEMKDFGFQPDATSYSIAICCFVEKEEIQEACSCHNKIIEMPHFPSVAAYSSLARGLCRIGEIDAVMMLVRECLGNHESGPMEFKYVLRAVHACRASNAENVMDVLDEMIQEGCLPSEVIYCAIISGMCKHGTIQAGREVFTELKSRKLLTEADMIVYDEMLIEHMQKKTADLVLAGLKFFGLESKLKAKGCRLLDN